MAEVGTLDYARLLVCVFRAIGALVGGNSQVRTLIQALKTKELRKKILFVLFIIIVYRIGSFIPTPGVDYNVVNKCMATIGSASRRTSSDW